MYQVLLKSEGGRPFFVITWPGITQLQCLYCCTMMSVSSKLCVVWPENEAMFSLDVLETSVAFEL